MVKAMCIALMFSVSGCSATWHSVRGSDGYPMDFIDNSRYHAQCEWAWVPMIPDAGIMAGFFHLEHQNRMAKKEPAMDTAALVMVSSAAVLAAGSFILGGLMFMGCE